jgi:hypothetical protein
LPANDDRSLWPLDYAIQRTRERGYTDVRFAPFTHVTSVSIREGREWFLVVRDDATSAEVAAMLQLACEKG